MSEKLIRCPHCGSDEGFYTVCTYKNVRSYSGFLGEEKENSEMYDRANVEGGNNCYCANCERLICRLSTLIKKNKIY